MLKKVIFYPDTTGLIKAIRYNDFYFSMAVKNMNKQMNVHSLDMLPLYIEMSQGQFSSSFEQLQHFEACKERPSVLDDDTVKEPPLNLDAW